MVLNFLVFWQTAARRASPSPRLRPPRPTTLQSAPVAVSVITYIAAQSQTQGLMAVPCVIGQLVQIFVGQPLAHHLAGRISRWRERQAALREATISAGPEDVKGGVDVNGNGSVGTPDSEPVEAAANGEVALKGADVDVERGGGAQRPAS
jgi:hypothetical protein